MASDEIMNSRNENKKCKQLGCDNKTSWINKPNEPRYTRGGYFRAKCYSCANLLQNYGIDTPQRDSMLIKQEGKCLICKIAIAFTGQVNVAGFLQSAAVDHCHTTGKVRGILCMQCNLDLGKYETLKPKFNAFANYVEQYGEHQ